MAEVPHWDACTMDPHQWMRFVECHPGFAGYIQAIGAIAAVFIAFLSPRIAAWFAERDRHAARLQRTRDLISGLETPAIDVGVAAAQIKDALDLWSKAPPGDLQWNNWCEKNLLLRPPPQFEFLYQALDGTEPSLIAPYIEIAKSIDAYNSIRNQVRTLPRSIYVADWGNIWRLLDGALLRVRNAIAALDSHYVPPR
jgi:hypothetical protein